VGDGTRFLHSIIWTALAYNPVRILGSVGLACLALTLLIGLGLVVARLQGTTQLGTLGVLSLFLAQVLAVTGVSVFALGATFNYLVSLFHEQPIRQGLFGRPIFDPPLERHFGWMGVVAVIAALVLGGISLGLGFSGWEVSRLWLYLLASAMLFLIGIQLMISWIVMRILSGLQQRETLITDDLNGQATDAD
jgi:hypothetical protein